MHIRTPLGITFHHISFPSFLLPFRTDFVGRELVNVVKHLQKFPHDSMQDVLENVFSFDRYDEQIQTHILQVFKKHRFPVSTLFSARPVKEQQPLRVEYQSKNPKLASAPKHGKIDPKNAPHVGGNTWAGGTGKSSSFLIEKHKVFCVDIQYE